MPDPHRAPATVADLDPEVREDNAAVVDEIYDREEDDYHQNPTADHPFLALSRLRAFLGPHARH